jgi:DNA-binding CsgD family transcriptional regulator
MKKVSQKKKQYQGAKIYTSLHHKFLIEFRYLISTIPNYHFLNKDDVETAITNAMVYFTKGVERKGIDTSKFENYKNYQFIIIKNEVKKANVSRMNNTKTARREHLTLDEVDVFRDDYNQQMFEQLQRIKSQLTEKEYNIVTLMIEGYEQQQIAKLYNHAPAYMLRLINKIRAKVFPNFKIGVRKYETRYDVHNTKRKAYVKPEIDYDLPDYYAD